MNNDQESFLFDEKHTKRMMRKARFRSTLKIIGITVIITPLLLFALWYGLSQLTNQSAHNAMDDIRLYTEISAPNVRISNQTYDYNLFGGEIQMNTYKVLGDRPYIWEPIKGKYNLFGTVSRFYGNHGSIQFEGSSSLKETSQFETYNAFTGDRMMFFYHPEIAYDVYKDNISEVNQFEDSTIIEMAVSFDQAYSLDVIQDKLPSNAQVVWWWVDAYADEQLDFMRQDQQTVRADYPFIYGFHSNKSAPKSLQSELDSFDEIEHSFIRNIEYLRGSKNFQWEIEQLYNALAGENGTLEKVDVKIIGAVVTGTPEQLQSLQGQPEIKASTFGGISDWK